MRVSVRRRKKNPQRKKINRCVIACPLSSRDFPFLFFSLFLHSPPPPPVANRLVFKSFFFLLFPPFIRRRRRRRRRDFNDLVMSLILYVYIIARSGEVKSFLVICKEKLDKTIDDCVRRRPVGHIAG